MSSLHPFRQFILCLILLLNLLYWPYLTVASGSSKSHSRDCSATWTLVSTQQNQLSGGNLQVSLSYISGPKLAVSSLGDAADADQAEHHPPTVLTGLTVLLATRFAETTVYATGNELTHTTQRDLTVTVPERGTVTVWQLTVSVTMTTPAGEVQRRYKLENIAVTAGGHQPPSRVVACTADYKTRQLVLEDTLVRLRHATSGLFLMMRHKRGWEAATLGYNREYRYRLIGVGLGRGVRIEAETHTYGGYRYAYASLRGGVYFDKRRDGSRSQLWQLSKLHPRDGDRITIRNQRWPTAALVYRTGSSSADVKCLNSHNPDLWIVEIAV